MNKIISGDMFYLGVTTMSCLPQPPAYQEYPADILNDVTFIQMSMAERGLLWTLRMLCWKNQLIPADKATLSNILKIPEEEIESLSHPRVATFFKVNHEDPTKIECPSLEAYRFELNKRRERRSKAGKAGADARWSSEDGNAISNEIAQE
jgi:hypothetical protein